MHQRTAHKTVMRSILYPEDQTVETEVVSQHFNHPKFKFTAYVDREVVLGLTDVLAKA